VRARLVTSWQTGTAPTGALLDVLGGSVTYSATNDVYSTLDLTVSADWPRSGAQDLTPYGAHIYVERGIEYAVGQREFVGLGYFRIDTMEQDDSPAGSIRMVLPDRSQGLIDARFVTPQQFPSSWARRELVEALIWGVYYHPSIIEWDDAVLRDGPVGRSVIAEEDRFGTLKEFLTSLGKVGYWDHRGIFVIKTPPSVLGTPAWSIDAGQDGVLVTMGRTLTREGVYNAVVATGEAADTTPPVTAVAYNLDPASPTYYNGPFGPVPRFYSSPFITTQDQAASAAAAILRQQLGTPYQAEVTSIVNPALEAWDVIDVKNAQTARTADYRTERHVIDEITIPLDVTQTAKIKTRQRQSELIGGL
jgi:hypothetical protein